MTYELGALRGIASSDIISLYHCIVAVVVVRGKGHYYGELENRALEKRKLYR
jgi:hypothetical protein